MSCENFRPLAEAKCHAVWKTIVFLNSYVYPSVATTIEITTTIEIIISIVVENAFQTEYHIATTNEITTTIEIIILIEVENTFKTKQSVAHY